jgi:hypothetical protein
MNFNPRQSDLKPARQPALQLSLARRMVLASACMLAAGLQAQTDNFDTGTDAGWSRVTGTNYPATYSFPVDSFGGHAYRLQGAATAGAHFGTNTARAAAVRTDRLYTNFFVAADLVSWEAGYNSGNVLGLLARATPSTFASGVFDGAMFVVEINRFKDALGSRGRAYAMAMGGGIAGGPATLVDGVLIPGRSYRLTFSGVSNIMTCAIYDLEDLTRPLISITGDDAVANSGFAGGPFPDPSLGGYSGLINFSAVGLGSETVFDGNGTDLTSDSTFDNFVASELPPTSVAAPATPHGLPGAPQVVNRVPTSFRNFHHASSGITFNATTLTTTNSINTNAIRLFLNGADVSSGLSVTGPATNAAVTYHNLASNAVYEARIELQDVLGRHTTNVFSFDTFSDAYLASSRAKNIECEDFNYSSDVNNVFIGNGSFIDDPLPSGYATNDTSHATPLNQSDPINNVFRGYLDLRGVNGIDFKDYDGSPKTDEHDFRFYNSAGTQVGNIVYLYSDANDPAIIVNGRILDTQRQKYSNVDPALHEYTVERTEGGEWLNYTRIFASSNYYNVYLRYCSGLEQLLALGVLPSTNNLGMFAVKTSVVQGNYRYAPLLDGSGKLSVVNLSGTNTLRLTMASPQNGSSKQRTALNYLAFVPALLLESAAQVTGPYSLETSASVDPGLRKVTVTASGSARFYRLRWDRSALITSVKLVGGNVELTYQ